MTLDGAVLDTPAIPLVDDGARHDVMVTVPAGAGDSPTGPAPAPGADDTAATGDDTDAPGAGLALGVGVAGLLAGLGGLLLGGLAFTRARRTEPSATSTFDAPSINRQGKVPARSTDSGAGSAPAPDSGSSDSGSSAADSGSSGGSAD